jgi:glycosyltransferase involved in cell wall biosynthesis
MTSAAELMAPVASRLSRPIRLAAVASHCVFYQVPLYRELARDARIDLTVFFGSRGGLLPYDADFGKRTVAWDVDLADGYRWRSLGEERRPLAAAVREVARADFDVVWVHGFTEPLLATTIAAARLARKPVLLREEQTLLRRRRGPKSWLRAAALRMLFTQVHALPIGTHNRSYFKRYGIPESRLHATPYCVDNEALRRQAAELAPRRTELRRSFGLEPDQPVVLSVGKLSPVKQPLMLLEAFRRVRAIRPCSLLFVGEGELESQLRAKVDTEKIPDVRFAGFLNRSEISTAYVAADVFAFPSRHETFGLAVAEAMNFGLPIVTSDSVGCVADLVQAGENGYALPSGDVDALAAALGELVDDEMRRRRFGARSLELIESRTYAAAREGIVEACEASLRRRR